MQSSAIRRQRAVQSQLPEDRLQQVRLLDMLNYLGIDVSSYLQKVPSDQVLVHLNNCESCVRTTACDKCTGDRATVCEMSFCPNFQSLVIYRRRLMDEI